MKTILCFGDSNTHGTCPMRDLDDRERLDRNARWPGAMAAQLGSKWEVIAEGHPGRTTVHDDPLEGRHKNGHPALLASLETHRPVDVLIMMLGTNDLKARFSVTGQDIARSVEKLVLAARLSRCGPRGGAPDIMLIAPPPIVETGCLKHMFSGGAAKSTGFGAHYAEVAERQACRFLNAGELIPSSPVDGVHLDEDAHRRLGTAVAERIAAS